MNLQRAPWRLGRDAEGRPMALWGAPLQPAAVARPAALAGDDAPPWLAAQPGAISAALQHALALPGGGWFVLGASRSIGDGPQAFTLQGKALVAWRGPGASRGTGALHVGADRCPHMGAALSTGTVHQGKLFCPWHGLALTGNCAEREGWRGLPVHDDGVLSWVQLPGEAALPQPPLPVRPASAITAVVQRQLHCEPRDVLANRLDPWHGVPFHRHSFAALQVLQEQTDVLRLRIVFRVLRSVGVEVVCSFRCTSPRCIVMTVEEGEGSGSVVETHATPIGLGRTMLHEATLVTSARSGFGLLRRASALVRPWAQWRAQRLWQEDAVYAERLYALRAGANQPRGGTVGTGAGLGNAAAASS